METTEDGKGVKKKNSFRALLCRMTPKPVRRRMKRNTSDSQLSNGHAPSSHAPKASTLPRQSISEIDNRNAIDDQQDQLGKLLQDISNTVDHLQEYETQQTMSNLGEKKETTGQEKCAKVGNPPLEIDWRALRAELRTQEEQQEEKEEDEEEGSCTGPDEEEEEPDGDGKNRKIEKVTRRIRKRIRRFTEGEDDPNRVIQALALDLCKAELRLSDYHDDVQSERGGQANSDSLKQSTSTNSFFSSAAVSTVVPLTVLAGISLAMFQMNK